MPFLWVILLLASGAASSERHFEVTASRFKYEPELLEVTEGDRVVVTIRSQDVEHGFAIKKLKLKADVPKGGDTARLEFVADKAGTYEISCSEYCGKGHARMKARLVVTPRTVGDAQR